MAKMKTNQEGGAILAKDSGAAGKQLESNQKSEGAAKIRKANSTKGSSKYAYKGAADYDTTGEKGSHSHPHGGPQGAARMGYNQSFGAARMGGYAKGAAKVANIMSFGASKYMKHGAANAGHGGPDGHDHPTMTTTTRNTSGGGGSASTSSSSGGGSSSSTQSTDNLSNYQAGLDHNWKGTATPEMTAAANAKVAALKAKDAAAKAANEANATSSSSSANTTNSGNSSTSSETIISPNSKAESQLQGEIAKENSFQLSNFNRGEADITATNDSITAGQRYTQRLTPHMREKPTSIARAERAGARAAYRTRVNSKQFSRDEAKKIYQTSQATPTTKKQQLLEDKKNNQGTN